MNNIHNEEWYKQKYQEYIQENMEKDVPRYGMYNFRVWLQKNYGELLISEEEYKEKENEWKENHNFTPFPCLRYRSAKGIASTVTLEKILTEEKKEYMEKLLAEGKCKTKHDKSRIEKLILEWKEKTSAEPFKEIQDFRLWLKENDKYDGFLPSETYLRQNFKDHFNPRSASRKILRKKACDIIRDLETEDDFILFEELLEKIQKAM